MDNAALTLAGLTSRAERRMDPHGNRPAPGTLRGVDWAPVPGALSVILGPPGAGKSALLRAIAGVDQVAGSIMLNGAPLDRRCVGVMLKTDTLIENMTLAQNVAVLLRKAGVRGAGRDRLVAEALDQMELATKAGLRPDQATPAERQRALLARAIATAPRLLLLDEPFAALGPRARGALTACVRRIHTLLGATTLLATEESADALAAADELAIMHNGTIVQHGPLEEVFDRPGCERTAALLGEINRLPGTVASIEDDLAMVRLACGPTVEGLAGADLREGDACVLALRPDRMAIAAATAVELGGKALDAILIESRFQGDSYRLRLLVGSGAEIVVRRPAAAGLRGLTVGGGAALAWQAQHAFIYSV